MNHKRLKREKMTREMVKLAVASGSIVKHNGDYKYVIAASVLDHVKVNRQKTTPREYEYKLVDLSTGRQTVATVQAHVEQPEVVHLSLQMSYEVIGWEGSIISLVRDPFRSRAGIMPLAFTFLVDSENLLHRQVLRRKLTKNRVFVLMVQIDKEIYIGALLERGGKVNESE